MISFKRNIISMYIMSAVCSIYGNATTLIILKIIAFCKRCVPNMVLFRWLIMVWQRGDVTLRPPYTSTFVCYQLPKIWKMQCGQFNYICSVSFVYNNCNHRPYLLFIYHCSQVGREPKDTSVIKIHMKFYTHKTLSSL